jgi:hypothetical protein
MFKEIKVNYGMLENIAKNIIIVDGITRSGKTMFNSLLSSLKHCEHTKTMILLEHIVPAISLGTLDHHYAKALLRIHLNELIYNNQISRNVNFRYDDLSGIFKYKEPEKYLKRLSLKDGTTVIDDLRKNTYYFPIRTHEILVNLEWFNMLEIDYRMIALFRNPIDITHSWWKCGWGTRFGNEPRAFTLAIEFKNEKLPWFCVGYEDEWLSLNSMERCGRTVIDLIERSVKQYLKVVDKSRIYLIKYEDFLSNAEMEIEEIAKFIGVQTTVYTSNILRSGLQMSMLDPEQRESKVRDLKNGMHATLFDKIMKLSCEYEESFYGLL